ncbi:MAG: phage holin family protein [Pseudomonadota bacterium]|jgi:VIT1/CCC1 family predicted Fe2+/Mn2+ transporter
MDGGGPMHDRRSLGELVGALANDISALVRREADLLRAEVREKLQAAARGAVTIAAGGALLMAALIVLLAALVLALATLIGPIWAALLVGVLTAALGYVLVRAGASALKPDALKPDRSRRQLKRDAELLKGGPR